MKSLIRKQNKPIFYTCCWMVVATTMLGNCSKPDTSAENFNRSEYYTRGIGVYPGNPSEDFSPSLKPDSAHYRNLAYRRKAYHSSSYDYNLTAQLVTDGVISDRMPRFLSLYRPNGEVPRREREWLFDQGPYSRNIVEGEDTYFSVALNNWQETATKLQFRGSVAYHEDQLGSGYEYVCQGSNDGTNWTDLGIVKGKGLPGTSSKYKAHSDPNKNSGEPGSLPIRRLNDTIDFHHSEAYSQYRVNFKMKGAAYWTIHELNFYNQNDLLNFLPSKFYDSAWMSATSGEEWVYVDLGSTSNFNQVILKWINKAIKGKIQVSNNAKEWHNIANLPGGERLEDKVLVHGEGRYIRILMTESADHKPYILSEIQVLGKGGMTIQPSASPAPTADQINLSGGNWKVQRASLVHATGEDISQPTFQADEWLVATVPGTVLTSYKNAGAVPNPNYADNLFHISESFFNSNFWYRDEFEVPEGFKHDRLFLNFDGINWKANIFVNGQKVGRLEGAFMRGKFDVTDIVEPGTNVVAVEIIKNEHIGAVKEKFEENTDFNGGILGGDNPTFHASIGWDWISTIRGRNIGIWNDVYVTSKGNVTLQDPFVQSVLPLPNTSSAILTPEVVVKNHDQAPVEGILTGKIGKISFEQTVTLQGGEEKTVTFNPKSFSQLRVKNPKLWWPKGYGEPYLYDANFTFKIAGKVSDTKDFKVGIRQMTFSESQNVLKLYVNGRRFIARGGNWGFSESNLNYRAREYDAAVAYHTDMNFTMMRNWVGQTGDEELYEACDRHGLMIWQDFWLANPSDGPDPTDEALFMANAADYVKRMRNHPSIGIYCGRNEGFPPETLDNGLRKLLKEEHPGIHYISSSADKVVSGHGPYRALPPKRYFTLPQGMDKLHSERGMPNVMNYESLVRTFAPEALWPQNGQWGQHDFTRKGAQSCYTFNELLENGFGKPANAKEFADLAQWINYNGYRALFESRSKQRKGLLLWMTHPCWPSMVWQTYDYYFEPTAAYFGCKKACEPLHIQWNQGTDEVEVVNYSAGNHKKLTAVAQLINLDGSVAWQKETIVNSHEDSTKKCFKLDFNDKLTAVHFVKLILRENGRVVSDNFYLRGVEEGNYQALQTLPKVLLKTRIQTERTDKDHWNATVTINNTSTVPALNIRLNVVGEKDDIQILPMFYSDNYFSLLPGEKKQITLHWKDVDTRGEKPHIVISGYNVIEEVDD